jgi:hypothetical protein
MLLHLLSLIISISGWAALEDCWNSSKTFYDCGQYGRGGGRSAQATGSDSFISNAAFLPTGKTPFGIEGVFSDRSFFSDRSRLQFSTIKGFNGIGFGLGNWTKGSFFAPNFHDHFYDTDFQSDYIAAEGANSANLGLRLGMAIRLPTARILPKRINFSVGGSVGQTEVKGSYSKQIGAVAQLYFLGLGYSQSFERISISLPRPRVDLLSVGIFLRNIYLGHSQQTVKSLAGKTRVKYYLLSYEHPKWALLLGVKNYIDHRGIEQNWPLAKLNRKIGQRFGVSYIYGLFPFSHSVGLQLFL